MRGVKCQGLQIFAPLSSHHVLLLCDRESYTLQNTRNNVALAPPSDMQTINGFQVVIGGANRKSSYAVN